MKKKSSIKPQKSKEQKESEKNISESDYINIIIIHNIDENQIFTAFSLKKLYSQIKPPNFKEICLSFHYLCNSPELLENIKGKEYLGAIFYILLFILEEESSKMKNLKEVFLNDIILLVNKLYLSKKLSNKDILLLVKFISFTSIHSRKEITQNNVELLMSLSNRQMKNYERFQLAMKLIEKINNASITYEFCKFLQTRFFNNKNNYYLFIQNTDLLQFLFLNDEENKILNFLTEIYSFKFNRHFLTLFLNKINIAYDIKNKNNNTIELLHELNKTVLFITQLKENEDLLFDEDPYILKKSFYFNDNPNNGIFLNELQIHHSITLIFSFNFSPKKSKQKNINKNKEYPIINFIETGKGKTNEKNGLIFVIKNGILYLKNFFNDKRTEILQINENQTYIVHYSLKEKNFFSLQIFSKEKEVIKQKNKFTNDIKKTMGIIIGKLNQANFEGYIGPIFIFKKYIEDIPQIFLNLKGSYEKALYYIKDYNTNSIDIYNKEKIEIDNKEDISKYLIAYITPLDQEQKLNKLYYYNTTFIETKISFYKEPLIENSCNYFIYNNFSLLEFIRYEGLNYIVLLFELITANIVNMNNDSDKSIIMNIFRSIINLIIKILDQININNFLNEIRCILFSLKKCVFEICQKIKIDQEIIANLKLLTNYLTSIDSVKRENNYIFIRNEILKFLLNFDIYDLTNYSSMQYFFDSLNASINVNCFGLTSMDIFRKIIQFTSLYNQEKKILHDENFKSLKHELNDTLISYLTKSEKIQPYNELFQLFSSKYDFDYKNYQYFKIFYLSSENFFSKENNKSILPVIKYFIDLFEYLSNNDYFNIDNSIKKEKHIIMAICLRFCLEYALIENIQKIKNYKSIKQEFDDRITRLTIGPDNKSLLNIEKDNLSDDLDIDINGKKLEINDIIAVDEPNDIGTD